MEACDTLEPLVPGDSSIEDGDQNPAQRSVPYGDVFYSCADRLFGAMASHCQRGIELRLRLGMFRLADPPENDRFVDVLIQGKDETEQFWLTTCLHCSPKSGYVLNLSTFIHLNQS